MKAYLKSYGRIFKVLKNILSYILKEYEHLSEY